VPEDKPAGTTPAPAPAASETSATPPAQEKGAAAPAAAAKPAPPKPAPKAPPPPSPPPAEMIGKPIKTFVQRHIDTGEPVTIETKRDRFTGRIFRSMIDEGWIAVEHVDGRRRAFYLIEGGTISSRDGETLELPSLTGK